ncbi:MAG: hypothetical protein WDW36_004001 [Sanguina aurantia]
MSKSVLAVIRAARPTFRSDADKVAFALHATLLSAGFRLLAVGDPPTTEPAWDAPEVGPEGWNANDGYYNFNYCRDTDDQHQLHLLLSCVVIDDMLMANILSSTLTCPAAAPAAPAAAAAASSDPAAAGTKPQGVRVSGSGSDEPVSLTLRTADYCSGAAEIGKCYRDLDGLVGTVNSAVEACTVGKQVKPAAPQPQQDQQSASGDGSRAGVPTQRTPTARDPDFDPLRDYGHPRSGGRGFDPRNPLSVGGEDYMPGGLQLPGGGGGGMGGGFPGMGGGVACMSGLDTHSSMTGYVTLGWAGHLLARGEADPPNGGPGGIRWDPINPQGVPGFRPEDFQRGGRQVLAAGGAPLQFSLAGGDLPDPHTLSAPW